MRGSAGGRPGRRAQRETITFLYTNEGNQPWERFPQRRRDRARPRTAPYRLSPKAHKAPHRGTKPWTVATGGSWSQPPACRTRAAIPSGIQITRQAVPRPCWQHLGVQSKLWASSSHLCLHPLCHHQHSLRDSITSQSEGHGHSAPARGPPTSQTHASRPPLLSLGAFTPTPRPLDPSGELGHSGGHQPVAPCFAISTRLLPAPIAADGHVGVSRAAHCGLTHREGQPVSTWG